MLLADGFETVEALAPLDVLRRGGIELRLVSLEDKPVTSSHGVEVKADMPLSEASPADAEMVILPGGRGVEKLENSPDVLRFIREVYEACETRGAYVAAICAAPAVLADLGLLKGRNAVCFPAPEFIERLKAGGANYQEAASVIADGPIVTAKAAGASLDFGLTLLELLKGPEAAETVKNAMFYNT
jgi:4-methyl-5(b-hydroxyethyl)-thiazole monophosphate biosynthesis